MPAEFSTPRFVVLCNPENRRLTSFQSALTKLGLPAARVVAYAELLDGSADLGEALSKGGVLRIESPGENPEVHKRLLALGADEEDPGPPVPRVTRTQALAMDLERGRIQYLAQAFFGFRAVLRRISEQLAQSDPAEVLNHPDDIVSMCDKPSCHARLEAAGVPVPAALGMVGSFEELARAMEQRGWSRVFLKPAYGSSASGVIALARHRGRIVAYTTVEAERYGSDLRLYNSLRVRKCENEGEIAKIIDTLCRDRVHVEEWIPKAGIGGKSFDLRVVVIGGRARHTVVRTSASPITNLHLGNLRGPLSEVTRRLGSDKWAEAMRTCERAVTALPHTHYAGIDLAIDVGWRSHAILEMNAFGDLLPGVLENSLDTYGAEIAGFCAGVESLPGANGERPKRGTTNPGGPNGSQAVDVYGCRVWPN